MQHAQLESQTQLEVLVSCVYVLVSLTHTSDGCPAIVATTPGMKQVTMAVLFATQWF